MNKSVFRKRTVEQLKSKLAQQPDFAIILTSNKNGKKVCTRLLITKIGKQTTGKQSAKYHCYVNTYDARYPEEATESLFNLNREFTSLEVLVNYLHENKIVERKEWIKNE